MKTSHTQRVKRVKAWAVGLAIAFKSKDWPEFVTFYGSEREAKENSGGLSVFGLDDEILPCIISYTLPPQKKKKI